MAGRTGGGPRLAAGAGTRFLPATGPQPRGVPVPETPQDAEREAAQGLRTAELGVRQAPGADAAADHQQLVGGRKRELPLDSVRGAGQAAIAASAAAGRIASVPEAPRPR